MQDSVMLCTVGLSGGWALSTGSGTLKKGTVLQTVLLKGGRKGEGREEKERKGNERKGKEWEKWLWEGRMGREKRKKKGMTE